MKHRTVFLYLCSLLLSVSVSAAPSPSAIGALRASAGTSAALPPQPALSVQRYSPPPASLSGEALFDYLHDATVPRNAAPDYKASKSYMYSTADNVTCNGAPGIITLYSRVCVNGTGGDGNSYKERGDQNGDGISGDFVNAEHIWPQSFFRSSLPMVADLHQLGSTLSVPNGKRGNLKYEEVSAPIYATSSGSKLGRDGFEPADAAKGDVARALLYFVVRYYDRDIRHGMDYASFWTKNVPMLLRWNRQDPPDEEERRRNDLIERYQGNRNPFVDDPSLADRIGEAVFEAH